MENIDFATLFQGIGTMMASGWFLASARIFLVLLGLLPARVSPCVFNPFRFAAYISGLERSARTDGNDSDGTGYGRHQLWNASHAGRHIGQPLSRPDAFGHGRPDEYDADRLSATCLYAHLQQRIDSLLCVYGYRHIAGCRLSVTETFRQSFPGFMRRTGYFPDYPRSFGSGTDLAGKCFRSHGRRCRRSYGSVHVTGSYQTFVCTYHRSGLPVSRTDLWRLPVSGETPGSETPACHQDDFKESSQEL